jgi:hypothetical protein
VTHEQDIGQHAKRLLRVRDGLITTDEIMRDRLNAKDLLKKIPAEETI